MREIVEIHGLKRATRALDVIHRYVGEQLLEQLGFGRTDFAEQFAADVGEREQGRTFVARVGARLEEAVFEQGVDGDLNVLP